MPATVWVLAVLAIGSCLRAEERGTVQAPVYTTASVVNGASHLPGLAPNTIASLYGTGLTWNTRSVTPADIDRDLLPTILPNTGVRVIIGGIFARFYYVSPTQLNLLIPSSLRPGTYDLRVAVDGTAGPAVKVKLDKAAPALFLMEPGLLVGTRPNGVVYTRDSPARPRDYVILYGTGLGQVSPAPLDGELVRYAAEIVDRHLFGVYLDGEPIADVLYAGVTPGFAGLYQINIRLPESFGRHPEVRLRLGDAWSPPGIRLPAEP
ncbi:MAG: hypothetical protein ACK5AZ_06245 [Bryobacteraceae bacterium]